MKRKSNKIKNKRNKIKFKKSQNQNPIFLLTNHNMIDLKMK